MRVLSVEAAASEARAAAPLHRRVIATDADGTLWEGDVGDALFLLLARRGALTEPIRESMRALHARTVGPPPDAPLAVAEALIEAHARGLVSIEALCDLETTAAGARSRAELDALMREAAAPFASRMRGESVRLIESLRAEGFAVHVVSASPRALVEAALAAAGLTVDEVSGATLQERDGWVTPELSAPIPMHHAKVEALRRHAHWPPCVGMGDGAWDASFLGGCALPLLVHPRASLVEAMKHHPHVARLSDVPLSAAMV